MIFEQLWDAEDLPSGSMRHGLPTGAAMPLCWSHAEYISLVRSRHDGVCFDRIEPAYERYVANPVASRHEIWTQRHPLRRMPRGKILRIILETQGTVVWSNDEWAHSQDLGMAREPQLGLWYADFNTADWPLQVPSKQHSIGKLISAIDIVLRFETRDRLSALRFEDCGPI